MTFDTTRLHRTWLHEVDFQKISRFWQNRNWSHPSMDDSEPEVNIIEIYVENHQGWCREFYIWIQFDVINKIGENVPLLALREDSLISEHVPWWEHQKSTRTHQKSMILEMNQDTCGDFLRYQESPGMAVDTTRLHKTWFQGVTFHRNPKILTKSWRMFTI